MALYHITFKDNDVDKLLCDIEASEYNKEIDDTEIMEAEVTTRISQFAKDLIFPKARLV